MYYKHAASLAVAKRTKSTILKHIHLLEKFPESGQKEEYIKQYDAAYRRIVAGNYKIIYRVEKNEIIVTDVFDSRQNPSGMKP